MAGGSPFDVSLEHSRSNTGLHLGLHLYQPTRLLSEMLVLLRLLQAGMPRM